MKFSILCDPEGGIEKVIQDPAGMFTAESKGSSFFNRVVPGDLGKVLNFFIELKSHGSAAMSDIRINFQDNTALFTLFGGAFGETLCIAGAVSAGEAKRLYDDLSGTLAEETVQPKQEKAGFPGEPGTPEGYYFDELTRVNNELINTQRELAKKNVELAELNKLKNQFLGIAAHDLRSPMGIIIGYSELLLEEPDDISAEERKKLTGRIYETGKFMLGLVNDLLDVTSIESGTLELNLSDENLDLLISHNIEMSSLSARSKNITIRYSSPAAACMVRVDKSKVDQALTNYLTNAIKFSFPGSSVEVLVDFVPSYVRITVRDHGQGIREEEVGNLFKPFQKTSTRSTAGEKSTGLGLVIVKKIIEAHGGEVGVKSQYQKGSDFYLTLPIL
jgi:signal transduction histidine kinase